MRLLAFPLLILAACGAPQGDTVPESVPFAAPSGAASTPAESHLQTATFALG